MRILHSRIDNSTNFIIKDQEARYVNREDGKLLIYLSSQGGCRQACRFCHLTQTGQTQDRLVSDLELEHQFITVLKYYNERIAKGFTKERANRLHLNFMARGEPLLNWSAVRSLKWQERVQAHTAFEQAHLNVSTIVPKSVIDNDAVFDPRLAPTRFYYSLYSLDPKFRKHWLPNAADPVAVRDRLDTYAKESGESLTIHYSLIKGWNDTLEARDGLLEYLTNYRSPLKVNLVRYNPHQRTQDVEADEALYELHAEELRRLENVMRVRIVPRVGLDVQASCGTFVAN